MTIGVLWREGTSLWAAADTRFSSQGTITQAQRITDHGPKLFPLGVTVFEPGPSGFFDTVTLRTTVGYLYAGEVGPALATHALSDAALQNLQITDNRLPSLSDVAEFVRRNAERYMRNWAERWPKHWRFEALIFGWCPNLQKFQVFLLDPKVDARVSVDCRLAPHTEPIAIGSGVKEFMTCLEKLRVCGDAFGRKARFPLIAVEELVASKAKEDIGGDVQLGYVGPGGGFKIMSRVRPQVPGTPQAVTTFLGLNTLELGSVGSCTVGFTGVA